jgi:hypothetical protein
MVGSTRRPSSARPRTRIAGKEGGKNGGGNGDEDASFTVATEIAHLATETAFRWQESSPVENSVARRWQTSSFGEQKSPRFAG